jgi:hypothetical protein
MRARIDILREVFIEWLRMHELDYDFWIYTQDEWAKKEGQENYLKGAELIIAFENQLYEHFNYPVDRGEIAGLGIPAGQSHPLSYDVEGELQDLAAGFGYWFEFGHHWNIGFYPVEDWPPLPPDNAPYREILKDSRWKDKRKRIIARSKNRCEECGTDGPLQVHHCYYRFGRQPWQYPDGALLALCNSCHERRQAAEHQFRMFVPTMTIDELKLFQQVWKHCHYWFDRGRFHDFLRTLAKVPGGIPIGGPQGEGLTEEEMERRHFAADYHALQTKIYEMLRHHGHPDERGAE